MIKIKNLLIKNNNILLFNKINFILKKKNIYLLIGDNGIGKSTLMKSFLNDENFFFKGEIIFDKINILNYNTDFISRIGFFYCLQNPIELHKVKNIFFLKTFYNLFNFNKKFFFKKIYFFIKKIKFNKELLFKNFNFNFSGGEKKKNEFLFLIICDPIFILLDEIDSGLDYNTLNYIFNYINLIKNNKYILIISHNININKILKINYLINIKKKKIIIKKC